MIILSISTFQEKSTEANKIREQNNEVQLKIKELEHNINKHRKDSQDAADKVQLNLSHTDSAAGIQQSNLIFKALFIQQATQSALRK